MVEPSSFLGTTDSLVADTNPPATPPITNHNPTQQKTLQELAAFNQRYEERFGHIFLVCATGKTAEEMLALLKARMGNEGGVEVRCVWRCLVGVWSSVGSLVDQCVLRT